MEEPKDRYIFLVGFMGSGKTTVGRALARSLVWPFNDIDEQIVAHEGRSISDIFRLRGEPYFRKIESEVLLSLAGRGRAVIALGGGTFCRTENQAFIKDHGASIWLNSSLADILRRLPRDGSRPLFKTPVEVEDLLARRIPFYEQADLIIATSQRRVDDIVGEVLEWLKGRWAIKVNLA
ncbi:MAG: shikimate kinase [Acidobacteria bacterium]|nr:shikimate kinase [Acidobacteriota bacterium]MBI3656483.1 shikimate kinase [Acidobacteriota bacterium]